MNLEGIQGRRLIRIATVGGILGILIIPLNPVNSLLLRVALLGAIGTAWTGLLILSWKYLPARLFLLLFPLIAAILFLLPGSEINSLELRENYVRRMGEFDGTHYHWGGESHRGIDCSGLPRRALRDALLSQGLRTANGRALRAGAELWWFDASARALGEGYRGYTTPLSIEGTVRELDEPNLIEGDLAVTSSRLHVLAYAGEGKWIQADPWLGKVATLDGRTDDNRWFDVPVTLHRWSWFSPSLPEVQNPAVPSETTRTLD